MTRAAASSRTILLGPQRLAPTLDVTLDSLGLGGKVATVTAGWQGREREDRELNEHLGGRTVRLELNRRAAEAFASDSELRTAHRERQDCLRDVQGLYRLRLERLMDALYALLDRRGDSPWLTEDREDAIRDVRALDFRHLVRVDEIHHQFEERWRPAERDAVAQHRRELGELLEMTEVLAIAGGHVAVLGNRMRLFSLLELNGERPIVAWSAGAMLMTDVIVLFHDNPPQGAGHAEVLEAGEGRVNGVVALPHAHRRLHLDDPTRVTTLASRFEPAACLAFEDGARIDCDENGLCPADGVSRLTVNGTVEPAEASTAGAGAP